MDKYCLSSLVALSQTLIWNNNNYDFILQLYFPFLFWVIFFLKFKKIILVETFAYDLNRWINLAHWFVIVNHSNETQLTFKVIYILVKVCSICCFCVIWFIVVTLNVMVQCHCDISHQRLLEKNLFRFKIQDCVNTASTLYWKIDKNSDEICDTRVTLWMQWANCIQRKTEQKRVELGDFESP